MSFCQVTVQAFWVWKRDMFPDYWNVLQTTQTRVWLWRGYNAIFNVGPLKLGKMTHWYLGCCLFMSLSRCNRVTFQRENSGLGLKLNWALQEWNRIQGWVKGTISEAAGEHVCWQERTHQSLSNRMRIHPLTRRLCFSLQWETGNIFRWDVLLLSHPKRLYPSFRAGRRDWEASLSRWPHLASSKFPHSFYFPSVRPGISLSAVLLFCTAHFWSGFSSLCCLSHCLSPLVLVFTYCFSFLLSYSA